MANPTNTETRSLAQIDRAHRYFPWAVQGGVKPITVTRAEGSYFYDDQGNRYLDFWSQYCYLNLGYGHPKVIEAIKRQADELCVINPNYTNRATATLAKLLAEICPGDLNKVFFTLGGAEANENAIKMARQYTGRHKIISRYRSYHGATAGAIAASGDPRRLPAEPGPAGFVKVMDPYCYRCPFGQTYPGCNLECASHIEQVIEFEGPDKVAAVIVEPITGSNGVFPPPAEYLPRLREICDRHGIVLIFDEVIDGFGRTGSWFACEHYDVVPDIITMAKGLTGGYVPLGALVTNQKLADFFEDHYLGCGLTYSGHPLGCAAGIASIEAYREEKLIEQAQVMGEKLMEGLRWLQEHHPSVGDIRGKGLLAVLELVKNRETKEPLVPWNAPAALNAPMAAVQKAIFGKGVRPSIRWNMIFLGPPLNMSDAELKEGIDALDAGLTVADTFCL